MITAIHALMLPLRALLLALTAAHYDPNEFTE